MKRVITLCLVLTFVVTSIFADGAQIQGIGGMASTDVTLDLVGNKTIEVGFTATEPKDNDFEKQSVSYTAPASLALVLDESGNKGIQGDNNPLYVYWNIMGNDALSVTLEAEPMKGDTNNKETLHWTAKWYPRTYNGSDGVTSVSDGTEATLGVSNGAGSYNALTVFDRSTVNRYRHYGWAALTIETGDISTIVPDSYSATLTLSVKAAGN